MFLFQVVLAFVTTMYMTKIQDETGTDNCAKEFNAAMAKGSVVPVLMEPEWADPNKWTGKLAKLRSILYISFDTDAKLDEAANAIRAMNQLKH